MMLKKLLFLLPFLLPFLASGTVQAAGGVLQINSACASSSDGCFPGDDSGTTVVITSPGSYILTSNLSYNVNTDAIRIQSDNVTLDLNGFTISGPVSCSGSPASCNQSGIGNGIDADFHKNVTIRNGTVRGMGANGIGALGQDVLIENVTVTENANHGIGLAGRSSGSSIARQIRASRNGATGVIGGHVMNSTAAANGSQGFSGGYCSNSVMTGNQNGSSCIAILPNICDDSTDCD